MSLPETPVLVPLLAAADRTLADFAVPAAVLPADRTCQDLELALRAHPGWTSVVVVDGAALGLLPRARFEATMSGRFGYGRALWNRRPVAPLADWDPLVLDAGATVSEAAAAVVARPQGRRYDDLVLHRADGTLALVSPAAVLESLAGQFALRALHDGLTGAVGRDLFFARLEDACRAAARSNGHVAVVYADLDRFKLVNDGHGHNAGDALLVSVVRRLRSAARPGDVVARLGGDEFAVLLALPPAAGPEAAEAAGHRVRAVLGTPDPELDASLHSTASVGVAVSQRGAADATTLLREADLAMYRGKSAGGDRVVVVRDVGGQLHSPLPGGELGAALAGDALTLHYQPIVEVATRAVASVEALVRWVHPRQGLLGPARILPEAERHGLLRRLDAWVLHRACADLARWTVQLGGQAPAYVNVNVSSALLTHPDLVATVLAAAEAANLDPARLRLEIPEAADLDAVLGAAPQLRELRSQGVSLTLDDMGAGSSSLRHLSQLAVDGLKIDRSFVAGLLGNDRDLAVVRLLVDLGTGLGLLVTAEGVEEAAQLARLADLGCRYAQGYHLGRPVPGEQLPAMLAAWAG